MFRSLGTKPARGVEEPGRPSQEHVSPARWEGPDPMFRPAATLTALMLVLQAGCYNTYNVKLDELAKAQEGGGSNAVELMTDEGEAVVVSPSTKLGVTTSDDRYHAISPFNFTLTKAQLVAPDEDLLLGRSQISTGNVKQVSGTKTALVVAGGVLALVGAAIAITLTAEPRKEFGE